MLHRSSRKGQTHQILTNKWRLEIVFVVTISGWTLVQARFMFVCLFVRSFVRLFVLTTSHGHTLIIMDRNGLWYATAFCHTKMQSIKPAPKWSWMLSWLRASEELGGWDWHMGLFQTLTVYCKWFKRESTMYTNNIKCRGPKHVDLFGSSAMNKPSYDPFWRKQVPKDCRWSRT